MLDPGLHSRSVPRSPRGSRSTALSVLIAVACSAAALPSAAAASDIVLHPKHVSVVKGHWARQSSTTGAGGEKLTTSNSGWSRTDAPLASPGHYFEIRFDAPANTTYRVWVRLRAADNSKWNDSVWVQFSDSTLTSGSPAYRIGTSSALLVNLERCRDCGTSGWGWANTGYWLSQPTTVRFASSSTHTIRVQTREDGVDVDQIVLSPAKYLSSAPGAATNDKTVLPANAGSSSSSSGGESSSSGLKPYGGSPVSLPGMVLARNFDHGGRGVAYYDTTSGNTGGAYRSTDVDLQDSSLGGHNIAWTAAGEWLKYSVNVAASGTYAVTVRVATPHSGRSVKVAFDRSGASHSVSVPSTGGWQSWRDVTFTASLTSGQQVLTLTLPQGGVNVHRVTVGSSSGSSPAPAPSPTPTTSGGTFRMMTWNIQHGRTRAGSYDVVGQAKFIASQNPHVVVLQEVQTWDENQPSRFKSLLEQYTGASWHVQWAPVVNKSATEGNVVLTRLPVVSSSYHQMHATGDHMAMYSNRSVARTTVKVGGVPVHVFSTHLDYYNTSHRTAQLLDMMNWTEQFGARRIVGGDFNSWWGEYWIITMMGDYYDTWQDVTGSNQNGYTVNNAVRFDYLFRSKHGSDKVRPLKVWVPSTSLSDHYPVVADYSVTP